MANAERISGLLIGAGIPSIASRSPDFVTGELWNAWAAKKCCVLSKMDNNKYKARGDAGRNRVEMLDII